MSEFESLILRNIYTNDHQIKEHSVSNMITIDSKWLAAHLDSPQTVIIDSRGNIPYRLAHIKNARPLGVEYVISVADNGANLALDQLSAEKIFSDLGIDDSKTVVVYGENVDPSAARIVWTLMYHGHQNTKLLDIGFTTWQRSGLPISHGGAVLINTNPVKFKSKPINTIRADADMIKAKQKDPNVIIVDSRTQQEHMQARIPGSILHSWEEGLGSNGAMFTSKEELQKDFENNGITPDKEIICYCHSGSRSSHKFLQFKQACFNNVRMYDGSIIDWAQRRNPLR
ncbi:MAG: sulfurtransferase [Nitrososphaeraceae archaeon]